MNLPKPIALIAAILLAVRAGLATELQVRARCQPRGPIVVLGDVVEVVGAQGASTEKLAGIELFPSPPAGQQRTLRVRDLQDLLANRGISLAEHQFSGASQVIIGGVGEQAPATDARPMSASAMKRAERVVAEAIVKYLQAQVSADETWQVDGKLTDNQARLIPADAQRVRVGGSEPPWIGAKRFEVSVDGSARPATFVVTANVSQLARVVVAAEAIRRGEMIRATDLELRSPAAGMASDEGFHSVEDVLGMEAVREIPAGTVLQKSSLRAPILVRRGEVVTVYSRSAGIRIRVTARAREDAALGELVAVESLADRKTYTARVCGLQEAEIYARAMQSAPLPTETATPRFAGSTARTNGRKPK